MNGGRPPDPKAKVRRVARHAVSHAEPTPVAIDRGECWVRLSVALPDGTAATYVITSAVGGRLDCVRTDALLRS